MEIRTTVVLPDMYRCFLVQEPRVNADYASARAMSEEWLSNLCAFDPKMKAKVHVCDFAYFCSIVAPDAPMEKLRTVCDWGNWVFPFDDMFDNGHLRTDLIRAHNVISSLMHDMDGSKFSGAKLPIVVAHDSVFQRIVEQSSIGVQRRFAKAMRNYAQGALHHVEDFSADRRPTLQQMLETRRLSVGVAPLYHLFEYANGLQIPDSVFEHPVIQKLEGLGGDFIILTNDMLSYRKEERENTPFNLVTACRTDGMTPQMAFDTVGQMLERCYSEWDEAIAQIPSWNTNIDAQVAKYIEGIQNTVQANISWSFRSQRYFGHQAAEVRKTREIDVLVRPAYLTQRHSQSYLGWVRQVGSVVQNSTVFAVVLLWVLSVAEVLRSLFLSRQVKLAK